ncbi:FMN-binding protein [Flagellimonas nanhaiensis]|uniref:FMN-binding protein n=1 Tax=Flagellimonas nanhaiensis TaxID=2292706 RepID=A0A371JT14_9FLAO|nr:FMN-binding protein [Allomuricauda nanhaiensis]RDY60962.1 FMN-binding protein [Allomuricauda nanhaiensis]
MKSLESYSLFFLAFVFLAFSVPKGLNKKVVKEVEKTFEVADFTMDPIKVSSELNENLPTKISSENLYRVLQNESILGYAFVDQAPSKTAKFDYLVIFDKDLAIINTKVLIYREEYGGEIGSKRWLKQFIGKTGDDRVSSETNIDAIAGATISVNSMTKAMDNLLQTIGILKDKGEL